MSRVLKALVVDDHPLIAQATSSVLQQIEGIAVVGVAGDGATCMEMVERHEPELVFLDYHLPGDYGSKIAARLKSRYPHMRIVIFTGVDVTGIYNKLLEIGVSGIISKEASEETLIHLVRCIMDNHTMVPIGLFHQLRIVSDVPHKAAELTGGEIEMMDMLVNGATLDQIADRIHVSRRSVDNYMRKIYTKLEVRTRAQAIEKYVNVSRKKTDESGVEGENDG